MVSHLTSAPASSSITDMGLASCSRACCGDHHITRLNVFDLRIYVLFPLLVMEMVWFCKITFCPSAWDTCISLWPLKVFREFKSHEPHLVGLITSGFLCVGSVCLFTYFISSLRSPWSELLVQGTYIQPWFFCLSLILSAWADAGPAHGFTLRVGINRSTDFKSEDSEAEKSSWLNQPRL